MRKELDHYEVLGVRKNATREEIRFAFQRLARKHHPDLSSMCDSHEKFIRVCNAYSILKDDKKRSEYNIELMDEMFRKHLSNSKIK